jgi:hypothetical protein
MDHSVFGNHSNGGITLFAFAMVMAAILLPSAVAMAMQPLDHRSVVLSSVATILL